MGRYVRRRALLVLAGLLPITTAVVSTVGPSGGSKAYAFNPARAPKIQVRLLDATADIEMGYNSPVSPNPQPPRNYSPSAQKQCAQQLAGNVKVNQGCLNITNLSLQGRAQAQNETSIAANPADGNQLVATSNDYRRGDGTCGAEWSNNGGASWQDSTLPNGFVNGAAYGGVAREYFQASGDPSVAWDTKGNVYYSCQQFMRGTPTTNNGDFSSSVYLYRSTQNGGASWDFPGTPVVQDYDTTGATLIDKPYMTVDNHVGSPYQDRVYVTWTDFAPNGTAYLWGAYSSDYGRSFSAPVLVSTDSPLCSVTYGLPTPSGGCNENQYSDPFTGPDGSLYVVYSNFNNSVSSATDNHNQILMVKSTDGGKTFSAPVLVGNYYDLPDCATYQGGQDAGRACVPEQGTQQDSVFRATNYPSGAVNPADGSQVAVTFGSYINGGDVATCTPTGFSPFGINTFSAVKTAACSNKIMVSVSDNGGSSFADTDPTTMPTVNGPSQAGSDQWFQWSGFTADGRIVVSYYDRQYGSDESTGNMDVTLSSSTSPGKQLTFGQQRVTSSSMPVPTEFPDAQGNGLFFGDYSGLAVSNVAHPLWTDTRSPDLFECSASGPPSLCTATEPSGIQANDQDIFTSKVAP